MSDGPTEDFRIHMAERRVAERMKRAHRLELNRLRMRHRREIKVLRDALEEERAVAKAMCECDPEVGWVCHECDARAKTRAALRIDRSLSPLSNPKTKCVCGHAINKHESPNAPHCLVRGCSCLEFVAVGRKP